MSKSRSKFSEKVINSVMKFCGQSNMVYNAIHFLLQTSFDIQVCKNCLLLFGKFGNISPLLKMAKLILIAALAVCLAAVAYGKGKPSRGEDEQPGKHFFFH